MKKESIYKILYIICIFLIIAFTIKISIDYLEYNNTGTSAPFYIFIIERIFEFIVPAIITYITGKILKNKYSK